MKHLFFIYIYISILIYPIFGQESNIISNNLEKLSTIKLSNGFKIILIQPKDTNLVFFYYHQNLPEVYEGSKVAYGKLTSLLFSSGSKKYNKKQLNEIFNKLNIKLKTHYTGLQASTNIDNADTLLFYLSDIIKNPKFSEEELKYYKKNEVDNHYASRMVDTASSIISKKILFGKEHPMNNNISVKTINNIKLSDCKQFYKLYSSPANSYLVIVGNYNEKAVKRLVNRYFGQWKKKAKNKPKYKTPKIKETYVAFIDTLDLDYSHIHINYPLSLIINNDDWLSFQVMNLVFENELRNTLINNYQIAEKVNSKYYNTKNTGYLSIHIKASTNYTDSIINETFEQMKLLEVQLLYRTVVNEAKRKFKLKTKTNFNDNASLAAMALNIVRFDLDKNFYSDIRIRIDNVTDDEIKLAAKKYLLPKKSFVLVIGDNEKNKDELNNIASNTSVEFYDKNLKVYKKLDKGFGSEFIIDKYLESLGGQKRIKKLSLLSIYTQGEYILENNSYGVKMKTYHKGNKKYYMQLTMKTPTVENLLIQKQIYNGEFGVDSTQRGQVYLKGLELEELKYKSYPFIELYRIKLGFKSNFVKTEKIDSTEVYKIKITSPIDKEFFEYYDLKTGLKLRTIYIHEEVYPITKTIIDYSNYEKIKGKKVLYPHKILIKKEKIVIKFLVIDIETKPKIEKDIFKIEKPKVVKDK